MGRSVSTHQYAVGTAYISFECEDPSDSREEWGYFVEGLQGILREKYPSFEDCDRWSGREDHVILENQRAEVSVSEYCGLVAVCIAPRDPDNALDRGWAGQVAGGFERFINERYKESALQSLGRMSNGEQVFQRVHKEVTNAH